MFTGKNKEDFEKWFKSSDNSKDWDYSDFKDMSFSMQQGVYLEYLDSVGIRINVEWDYIGLEGDEFSWFYWIEGDSKFKQFPTRQEALKEAFKKADELINKL